MNFLFRSSFLFLAAYSSVSSSSAQESNFSMYFQGSESAIFEALDNIEESDSSAMKQEWKFLAPPGEYSEELIRNAKRFCPECEEIPEAPPCEEEFTTGIQLRASSDEISGLFRDELSPSPMPQNGRLKLYTEFPVDIPDSFYGQVVSEIPSAAAQICPDCEDVGGGGGECE
ncbi:hypothetical protein [Aurantimonas sp. A3-2-R12]|uniref:hypothetical protein n=1 Tax=Aurantimonas sp. A3-2-R12 TaxID=3114362 RepID=UPI002E19120F|nr:hypothetical protein [Aurantimonas sp. A3-2-R12]